MIYRSLGRKQKGAYALAHAFSPELTDPSRTFHLLNDSINVPQTALPAGQNRCQATKTGSYGQNGFSSVQNGTFKVHNKPQLMFKETFFLYFYVTWFFSIVAHVRFLFVVMFYFQVSYREQLGNLSASGYCLINFNIIK